MRPYLFLLAGAAVFLRREPETGTDVTLLLEAWVTTGQVPTNGELLAAYKGYRR